MFDTIINSVWKLTCFLSIVEERKFVLYMSVCTDGSGFFQRGNLSWGPYTGICFNLPPWLRNKFACLFMFGVMPVKIKNYNRKNSRYGIISWISCT